MGKNNLIISVIENNLSEISNTLESIVELNYSHRHEELTKHIINAFVELKLAMVCVENRV